MLARLLADGIVLIHLIFILLVVFGGLLVMWRRRLIWLHLPAVIWGVGVELFGGVCPLTPLEVRLREGAAQKGYEGGFIEHYLLPVIYPDELTRSLQIGLGLGVLAVNLAIYAWILRRRHSGRG
jgi:hypothetical protein